MQGIIIQVYGKVQGVWYRASTRNKARELGLCGIVRNESDGSVYIEAEGPAEAVEALREWCKQGPPHARVERIESRTMPPVGRSQFEVHR
ncbi:MAG: acylphosphatase [Bacteroidota bacterium]